MNTYADKMQKNKRQSTANYSFKRKGLSESTFLFVDNRHEAIAQNKMQEVLNNRTHVKQLMDFKEIENNSHQAIQLGKKKKGASIGKSMRKSGAANVITNMFILQHMGNYKTAEAIAEERAGYIPGSCHVISISELSKIYKEINNREIAGYHLLANNRVINPATGNNQFSTANSYKIFEFKYDKRNRVKKGRELDRQFYYDAIPNGAGGFSLHHFDGVV